MAASERAAGDGCSSCMEGTGARRGWRAQRATAGSFLKLWGGGLGFRTDGNPTREMSSYRIVKFPGTFVSDAKRQDCDTFSAFRKRDAVRVRRAARAGCPHRARARAVAAASPSADSDRGQSSLSQMLAPSPSLTITCPGHSF